MAWEAWLTIGLLIAVLTTLIITELSPHLVMMAALSVLSVSGVLSADEALRGFSNPGLMTVAALFIVAAGMQGSGAIHTIENRLLGQPRSTTLATLRLCAPMMVLSAFLNNTPVVATLIPTVRSWATKIDIPSSKLLIPLSYASILGGTLTLIGTSTNLVVSSQYAELTGNEPLGLFSITVVGLPVALFGLLLLIWVVPRLLPHKHRQQAFAKLREFTLDVVVDSNGPLVGKTISEAGLRNLKRLFLAEIERDGSLLTAVSPLETLKGGDRLTFAGDTDALSDLLAIRGILPSNHQDETPLELDRPERCLVEVVLSPHSAVLGLTIKDSQFRDRYGAVVLAVARNGERVAQNLGATRLRAGDTLLLEARPNFVRQQRLNRDFLLVSDLGRESVRHNKATLAWLILATVIISVTFGLTSILNAALLGAAAMIALGCCSVAQAHRSLDLPVLITIGASFALGTALHKTGAAQQLAMLIIHISSNNPVLLLITLYLAVSLLTESITNNGAAILMLPVVLQITGQTGHDPIPFVLTIMMAASASFATPLGYQTNLMVYGPGNYSFRDFLKAGLPMNLLIGAATIISIVCLFDISPGA
ncbi:MULTISPECIES: SLC13 family permease [unclassified Ketobacter]|jgi:di/tricarboxylate transporter|uniref:SLC13 family permease n=1 Tax=unclassified Ketobacter TaxID=2639109 RepID=UPI000F0FB40D|nr:MULTISPECIES: SLC13 family permease [unclassified Ketobacter]MEC8813316.1 SLC13 family permease [Pseudomonadota bacterium]RLT90422.1 MAG: SLC13 family permease [Ketobacter sp. GenoA1]RLT99519.1 MAG: SLC13 family permease [Ketobacter sp.]